MDNLSLKEKIKIINYNSQRPGYTCPLCRKQTSFKDSTIYEVEGAPKIHDATWNSTTYIKKIYNVRVCKECAKKCDRNTLRNCLLGFVLFTILFILFTYFYFNVEKFWISDGFITTNIEERTIWSYLGWCPVISLLNCVPVSFICLFIRNFYTSPNNIIIEDAFKCNAIAPPEKKNSKSKK